MGEPRDRIEIEGRNGACALLRDVYYASGESQTVHRHGLASLTLVYAGSIEETVGVRQELAGPLSVVVKPAGLEHADRFGPDGARTLQIILPAPIVVPWRWLHVGKVVPPFLELLRVFREQRDDGVALKAALRRLLHRVEDMDPAPRLHVPSWLRRVAAEIDANFADPVSVKLLAHQKCLHPVVLARTFRKHYGTSITERRKRRRVREAASLLGSGDRQLSQVALGSGFSDQSHMCRIFKEATGLTPLHYRRIVH